METYIYGVIFLNFLVDLLLLLGVNRMYAEPSQPLRILAAATIGGIYGGMCFLPGFRFLGGTFWRIVSLWLIALVAFGFCLSTVHRGAIFFILTMALSGVVAVFDSNNFLAVLCSAVIVLIFFGLGRSWRFLPKQLIPVELTYGCLTRTVTALRDTGNTLIDPVTGESVLIISADIAEFFTGLSPDQLKDPVGSMGALPGLRLIPYRTVGSRGMLLALRFPYVKIGTRKGSALVAFSTENLHNGGKYQALTGGVLV